MRRLCRLSQWVLVVALQIWFAHSVAAGSGKSRGSDLNQLRVATFQGTVEWCGTDRIWSQIGAGQLLLPGTRLITDPDASIVVRSRNGDRIAVGGLAEIEVLVSSRGGPLAAVLRGRVTISRSGLAIARTRNISLGGGEVVHNKPVETRVEPRKKSS
jgi:hypothetical protein